jgi:hypothetical protein
MAPALGVVPTITEAAVCEGNAGLAPGNRCISIGHKEHVTNATLLALSEAGVTYISNDLMDPISHHGAKGVTQIEAANRECLRSVTYFDFPITHALLDS